MAFGPRREPGVYFLKNGENATDYEYLLDHNRYVIMRGVALIVNVSNELRVDQDTANVLVQKIGNYKPQITGGGIVDVI